MERESKEWWGWGCPVAFQSFYSSGVQPLIQQKYESLLASSETAEDSARLLAVASEHSSDWLNARPVSALGLKLDNSTIKIACGLRLGTALCQPHKCKSGADVDKFGRHGLSCKSAEGRHPRHTHSNIILSIRFCPSSSWEKSRWANINPMVKWNEMGNESLKRVLKVKNEKWNA